MSHPQPNVSLLDSPLFGAAFSNAEMRAIFSPESYVARCVETEVALAHAQAKLDLIPETAAAGIAEAAHGATLDMARIGAETQVVGYPILPIVEQLAALAGDAGKYLHWGATTQDIMDTATVLQLREASAIIARQLDDVRNVLSGLAAEHRDTAMAGRTHMQHALPVTFGYKAAVWLSALDRHAERLEQLLPRLLVVEFSGASGTLASLGDRGLDVQAGLAAELELGVPAITWHSVRDSLTEAVQLMAMIAGSLAKIAFDISIMMTTELGEVSEPFVRHRGASSTMPQKQNPISCEIILAGARFVRNNATLMLDAMVHDFERATGPWHLEWAAVPEAFTVTAGCLEQADFMLRGLQVFPDRMLRNLNATDGLIVAEAVMMALAEHTGRKEAHDIVYLACRTALAQGRPLLTVLSEAPEALEPLGARRLAQLCDATRYMGTAAMMVDRMLAGRGSAPAYGQDLTAAG